MAQTSSCRAHLCLWRQRQKREKPSGAQRRRVDLKALERSGVVEQIHHTCAEGLSASTAQTVHTAGSTAPSVQVSILFHDDISDWVDLGSSRLDIQVRCCINANH
eukprot:6173314-Pleurochrysis_carterae.AAC.2